MTTPALAIVAVLCLVLGWWWLRRRSNSGAADGARPDDALDTLAAWPPEAARVLTTPEQRAYQLLARSLPAGCAVLAQVPLSRFLRVPTRYSYREWVRRVGRLNADLLVCDSTFQVLAVINVRTAQGGYSSRSAERHARMDRVLGKAGLRVLNWHADALPRADLVPDLVFGRTGPAPTPQASTSLAAAAISTAQPDPDDAPAAAVTVAEPLSSTFFDDLESRPVPLPRPRTRR